MTTTGTIPIDAEIDCSSLVEHIAERLRCADAKQVRVEESRISFKGGLTCGISSWNVLRLFGHGELEIDMAGRFVCYRLNLTQFITTATVLVVVLSVVMPFLLFVTVEPQVGVHTPAILLIAFPFVGWIWLVGGNLAMGIPRFRNFLRRSISTAPTAVAK